MSGQPDPLEQWPVPINLFRGLVAPALTAADAPPVIAEYAEAFARAGGFDLTGCVVSAIGATAAVIDDGIRLHLPGASGHFESARLWLALVGSPGSGKSPTQRTMLAPVYQLHRDAVEESERERKAAGDAAEQVRRRAVFTSDCTIDKLSEILADNPRGILYTVDEFESWLGQHEAFSRDWGSRGRGEWMRLYDGGPHQVDRIKRGSFFVKNWGASLLTATTPAALTRLANKLPADGLFQRFMVFAVQAMRDRDPAAASFIVQRAQAAYSHRLIALFGHAAALYEHPIVHLSAEAAALYEAEEKRLRALVEAAENIGDGFAAHIAKHTGMLARVALCFHALDDSLLGDDGTPAHPCSANCSAATLRLAIGFIRRAYQHAHAIYTQCLGAGSPLELARAIARSALADEMPSFNRREITHACRAFRGATEWQRIGALRALQDYAWIEGDTLLPEHGGRWTVNPRVHALFAAERERARERRRLVTYAIHGIEPTPGTG
jgi:hypothetical protein